MPRPAPHRRLARSLCALLFAAAVALPLNSGLLLPQPARAGSRAAPMSCAQGRMTCTEVFDSEAVFGEGVYVGHDEPSLLFYANTLGSGNSSRYQLTLPSDPPT